MNPTNLQPVILDEIQSQAEENQYQVTPTTSHKHNGTDMTPVDYTDCTNRTRYILIRLVSATSDVSTGTAVGGTFVMPFTGFFESIGGTVDTAGTTNKSTFKFLIGGVSILLTDISIDSTETSSRTAATPYVFNQSKLAFTIGDILTINVDTVSSTKPKGLTIFARVVETSP